MRTLATTAFILTLSTVALPAVTAAPASAADVIAQTPCPLTIDGACRVFDFDDTIPVIRSFAFNMPRAGKALIRFDGTMQCIVLSPNRDQDVIDLASQIVTNEAAIPVIGASGGSRLSMRLHHNGSPDGPSTTVNLASSRVLNFPSGGVKTVFFKIGKFRMDPASLCRVWTGAFTVETLP